MIFRTLVFAFAAGASEMEVLVFEASIIATNSNGDIIIALFDGSAEDRCVGIWRCRTMAAEALKAGLSSALNSKSGQEDAAK